jgi:hypothetical protein
MYQGSATMAKYMERYDAPGEGLSARKCGDTGCRITGKEIPNLFTFFIKMI